MRLTCLRQAIDPSFNTLSLTGFSGRNGTNVSACSEKKCDRRMGSCSRASINLRFFISAMPDVAAAGGPDAAVDEFDRVLRRMWIRNAGAIEMEKWKGGVISSLFFSLYWPPWQVSL